MYRINNFFNPASGTSQNGNIRRLDQKGAFTVIEYQRDLSVDFSTAKQEYFASQMDVRRKQLACNLSAPGVSGVTLQAGAMQWMAGNVQVKTGIKSAGDLRGKGLFNLKLTGSGAVCLESNYPKAELVEIVLENDEIKVDGSFVIAWSGNLDFTVECAAKGFIGSAASGEGLVNVYRGTGRLWMIPVG